MRKLKKFAKQRPVFVLGVIGPSMGNVLYHMDTRSFNAKDMEEILLRIRKIAGPAKKLALVLDNCQIHVAKTVQQLAAEASVPKTPKPQKYEINK